MLELGLSIWPRRFGPSGAHGTWTPASLGAALVRDWNPASLSNGVVSSFADAIAGHAVTQGTGAAQPVKAATSFNGAYPGVTFDGIDDELASAVLTGIPTGSSPGEIWWFGATVSTTGIGTFVAYGVNGASLSRIIRKSTANTATLTDGAVAISGAEGAFGTGNHILGGSWSGVEERGYGDGAPFDSNPGTIATLATGTTRLRFGANAGASAGQFFNGVTGRVFIINGLTSDADKRRIEGWGAHTYGMLSVLPSNHPYKVWAP